MNPAAFVAPYGPTSFARAVTFPSGNPVRFAVRCVVAPDVSTGRVTVRIVPFSATNST